MQNAEGRMQNLEPAAPCALPSQFCILPSAFCIHPPNKKPPFREAFKTAQRERAYFLAAAAVTGLASLKRLTTLSVMSMASEA